MSWLSSLATNPTLTILFLFLLFLPSQLGRHFWPSFAFINGLRIDYLSPTLYFTDILFCLLLLEMLPNILRAMKQPLSWVVVAVLGLFSYLSLTSQLPLNSLWGVVRLLQVVLLIWFFSFAMKRQSNRLTLALAIAISLIYSSLLAIWQFINQSSVGGLWYYLGERSFTSLTPGIADASLRGTVVLRPYATFPHPNVLAGFCIIMVTYLLLLAPSSALRWWQGLKGVALGLGMVALVVSLSRGAIVVGGLVGIVWFISRALASPRRQKIFVGVCVVLVFLAWQTGLLLRLSSLSLTDQSVTIRETLFTYAVTLFMTHPLVGVGLQNFLPSLAALLPVQSPLALLQPVHSVYLLILTETGMIGLTVFCFVIAWSIWRVFTLPSQDRLGRVCLLGVWLLLGTTDHYLYTLHQGQLLTAFVFGVVVMPVISQKSKLSHQIVKNLRTTKRIDKSGKSAISTPVKNSRIRRSRKV